MSTRAGIIVTGTEVLTGRVQDRNGPWLAEELRRSGVDVGRIVVVGDRPGDLMAALGHLADHDLIITTGGLGPTADDLTVDVVAEHQGRELGLDDELADRIEAIVLELARARGWAITDDLVRGVQKQARVPRGARVLEPTGTAPGLVVPGNDGPPVVVLPGPPAELQQMWPAALGTPDVVEALAGRREIRQETVRIWGSPESELAGVLRAHDAEHDLSRLEVTTCMRDGELEVVSRFSPAASADQAALREALVDHFGVGAYSIDGRNIDRVVADLLLTADATVATAESCTAGLLAGRLADLAGSSAYLHGGFVTYSNAAKTAEVGVPARLIDDVGAVSAEVATAMAEGARARLATTYGLSTTGVAGPGGGTPAKPVGLVHVAVAGPHRTRHLRLQLGGDRAKIRQRAVVATLHLLREELTA